MENTKFWSILFDTDGIPDFFFSYKLILKKISRGQKTCKTVGKELKTIRTLPKK